MTALISSVITSETLGREGMLATSDPNHSMVVRHATATQLYFGRAVIRASTDTTVVHPSGSAGTFIGLVIEDPSVPQSLLSGAGDIPAGFDAGIMTSGVMWVIPEVNVTQGEAVYYRHASAGSSPEALGRLRNDTDSGDATVIDGAQWFSTATAGNPAMVRLNTK